MVSLSEIRSSNASFKTSNSKLVAVFVGATSGIGLGTLKAFTSLSNTPTIYILGRSKHAAASLLSDLAASNPTATLNFIETEISLMKNVDAACDEIKSKESKVDILFLSPGYLSFGDRDESTEGIDIPHALRYYTRLRFVSSLLPLLTASPAPHVISILAGGQESALDLSDLEVKNNFSMVKAAGNGTTQTTLAFEHLAVSHPKITFIHKYPGFVNTGVVARLMGTTTGLWTIPASVFRWLLLPVVNLFSMGVEEAGERGVYLATSERYTPGVWRVGAKDEEAEATAALVKHREDGDAEKVWESTVAVWERALARSG